MVDLLLSLAGPLSSALDIPSLIASGMVSHARLIVHDSPFTLMVFPPDNKLRCQFNPESLSIDRKASWHEDERSGNPVMPYGLEYQGTRRDTLSFELHFDESEYRAGLLGSALTALMPMGGLGSLAGFFINNSADVIAVTQAINQLMLPIATSKGARRPPFVTFSWGSFAFTGVVADIDTEYTLFDTSGNPRRALLDIKMLGAAWVGQDEVSKHGLKSEDAFEIDDAVSLYDGLPSAVATALLTAKKNGGLRS